MWLIKQNVHVDVLFDPDTGKLFWSMNSELAQ